MAYDLTLEFHLPVPPAKVMRLLTDAELIKAWSGNGAKMENKVGGKMEYFDNWVSGNVLKTGDDELAYTWSVTEWDMDVPPSEVHYKLFDEHGGTRVEVKHINLPDEEEMKKHEGGWTEHFFGPMENYILENDF
ncbi:MAG: SRPBCC domain-containing protein [Chitinophagaceae bacterium]|nr:SRPBCC domain-containing protein [Chitinophagaceae bacterium]MCB9044755.1 SRPBCC domain-containing protein [Chitinophagales bacterium]